jgi:dihydrofolate reductase
MSSYEQHRDISQELQEYSKKTYSSMSDDVKNGINNILGKNKDSNMRKKTNMKALLIGASIGGAISFYKGWSMFLGIGGGAIIGNFISKKMN